MLTVILIVIWFISIVVSVMSGFGPVYNLANTIAKTGPVFILGSLML
jgi:hypothetical protein